MARPRRPSAVAPEGLWEKEAQGRTLETGAFLCDNEILVLIHGDEEHSVYEMQSLTMS